MNQEEDAARTILSYVQDIICVDNPPPEYGGSSVRSESQRLLLTNLVTSHEKVFKLPQLEHVHQRITGHLRIRKGAEEKQLLEMRMRTTRGDSEEVETTEQLSAQEVEEKQPSTFFQWLNTHCSII
jgi:hypothetical protein